MPTVSEQNQVRSDPLRNFKFQCIITKPMGNGAGQALLARAGFMSISGLSVQTEMIPYREGGMNTHSRKMPGQSDFPPLQLQRGMFAAFGEGRGHASWAWFKEIFFHSQGEGYGPSGNNFRTNIMIGVVEHPVTQGPQSQMAQFRVMEAWPGSVAFSDLDAGGNAVMVEQLVLHHEGLGARFATSRNPTSGSFTAWGAES